MLLKIIFMIGLCWGTGDAAAGVGDDSLNLYLDLVFDNLQVLIIENGYDPAALPNATAEFSEKVLLVTWHGEAALYDGWLRGISSLHRSSNADFVTDEQGVITGITAGSSMEQMKGHYKCLAKFMDLGPIADVVFNINGVDTTFAAILDRQVCRFKVSSLNVDSIGHISVDIHGLGPLNWIMEIVSDLVVNVAELFIRDTIEDSVQSLLNEALDSVDISILGPILGCDPVQ
ncbi:mite allergen Lep d 7-like isoform X2 [Palaemon carinicauda]